MGCPRNNTNESYSFFENIEVYLNAVKSSGNTPTPKEVSKECTSMSDIFYKNNNPEVAKSICEQFLKLYKSLIDTLSPSRDKTGPSDLRFMDFLNYWLNAELKKKMYNKNICVRHFYDDLDNYAYDAINYSLYNYDKIYVIKNDDLENMNILYNLYSNFYIVYDGSKIVCDRKDTCLEYSKKCVQEYKKGIIKCKEKGSVFCQAIEKFNGKYESLQSSSKSKGDFNSKDLISLPSYEQAFEEYQSELNKRITIFTPFGKWISINKKNQEKRHVMKEKMYNYIDNSKEYSIYNEYTPYRFGYNST
ncbi:unnamed protein product [Plasmodium vivax]|uniref:(malaria parasite P. vivax) hypothetical protein n=1 Tax=Plasmodium vivax TaxID=5855 RepID=A0A8S4HEX0_PLAVI|nr:unnamed protein product [Plasmodium vivax]